MTTTTYYNLNIVEGTDIVNPLTVDNPNYEKIDETMHNNAVAGVTLATEIANATVHAITRENSDCAVIRFIATSQWKAGDTATVDGVPVTALLPSGETLPDGAYVINANVLCILTGTNLTFYLEKKKAENANEITFNDTTVAAELVSQDEHLLRLDGEIVRLDQKIDNANTNLNINTASGVSYCKFGNGMLLQINSNINNISSALSTLGVELNGIISITGTHNNNNAYKIATLIINQDLTVTCYSRAYGQAINTEETAGYFNGIALISL